MEHCRERS